MSHTEHGGGGMKRKPSREVPAHSSPPPFVKVQSTTDYETHSIVDQLQMLRASTAAEEEEEEKKSAVVPKESRNAQPLEEREYYEQLWAQNFQASKASAPTAGACFLLPFGAKAALVAISGVSIASSESLPNTPTTLYSSSAPAPHHHHHSSSSSTSSALLHQYRQSHKSYAAFRIELECPTAKKRWVVWRRFHDFIRLNAQLKNQNFANLPQLPSKTLIRNTNMAFLNKRRVELEKWLRDLMNISPSSSSQLDIHDSDELRHFLTHDANQPPKIRLNQHTNRTRSASTQSFAAHTPPPPPTPPKKTNRSVSAAVAAPKSNEQTANSSSSNSSSSISPDSFVDINNSKLSVADFDVLRVLGKGSFGSVVLVRKKKENQIFAMKLLSKPNIVKKKQVAHTQTERRVLGAIDHPFIVRLHYAFQTRSKLYFILDYCPGGDIFFHLSRNGCFPEYMAKFYAAEIALALIHLHSKNIVYRDLKPENILLDADGHVKLADFGLSKEGVSNVDQTNTMCGTPEYLPPEILNRNGHGTAVDWWNLGMVLYEMLTGRPPWYTTDRMKLFLRLRKAQLEFPQGMSEEAMSLIEGLLNRNPEQRLGSGNPEQQILNHPFFAGFDWPKLYQRKVDPPFSPCQNSDPLLASNFDESFTAIPVNYQSNSPAPKSTNDDLEVMNESLTQSLGQSSSLRALSYTFQGFTYEREQF